LEVRRIGWGESEIHLQRMEHNMSQPKKAAPVDPVKERQERIDAVMKELRPKMEAMLQKMVETVVDKPEAEELGDVEFELRDMGRDMVASVQETGLKSRKKRGT
jgi:hypothetical protein